MEPTLSDGDWLLVLRGGSPRPGQLVVTAMPESPGLRLVKRIVRREPHGWWLEGDNTGFSTDSRSFGAVAEARIEGVVIARYWPKPRLFVTGAQVAGNSRLLRLVCRRQFAPKRFPGS